MKRILFSRSVIVRMVVRVPANADHSRPVGREFQSTSPGFRSVKASVGLNGDDERATFRISLAALAIDSSVSEIFAAAAGHPFDAGFGNEHIVFDPDTDALVSFR
ncbi:MAG: hypothetical protein IPK58_15525 [Acidobacteria bacterium]|nr:hypothetical protein [Acidobacteriota bacterium]